MFSETAPVERRTSRRVPLSKAAKVFHPASGKYWPGVTWDQSDQGMLLGVDAPRDLTPGEEIEVFIAWGERGLLSRSESMKAQIRRVLKRTDGKQMIGIELAEAMSRQRRAAA